jgi:hypothetical protein
MRRSNPSQGFHGEYLEGMDTIKFEEGLSDMGLSLWTKRRVSPNIHQRCFSTGPQVRSQHDKLISSPSIKRTQRGYG